MKSDDLAQAALEAMGYEVSPTPPSKQSGKKEADFLVSYQEISALIEAKLKENDPEEEKNREDQLTSEGWYSSEHVRGRDETISGIIRNGARQLKSSENKEHEFKILFFVADCINSKTVSEQFIDTIYGRTEIMECDNQNSTKKCYFYRNSDFYRRRIIDAAIVGHISNGHINLKICLNPYSENYLALKNSKFIPPFDGAIIDPIEEEKLEKAYIPDDNIERKEHPFTKLFSLYDPVLIHLAQKYKTKTLIKLDPNQPEITVRNIKP